jgi:polysaccharide biosynthesis protein PslH
MSRRRLLFLCQTLPYPPDGGVHIRAFHLIRLLATEYDVTALCFFRRATRRSAGEVQESLTGLRPFADAEAFPIPQDHSRLRFAWDHLRSVTTGRVYTLYVHRSRPFRARLRELAEKRSFDLIHVDSLDLSTYLKDLPKVPVILDHHNVESQLLARRAAAESSRIRRRYMVHQADLMEREERRWCPRVHLNLLCSEEDRNQLIELAPGSTTAVIPNGVDTGRFKPAFNGASGAVFVGGYTWFPNRDGMEYFAREILPLIREGNEKPQVCWVGRAPEDVATSFRQDYGIEMTGYVEDIRPFVEPAGCFLVPLRVGGGTRLKILDAWAMGKAIVSSSVGAEGLAARDGENILIRDTAQGFADAVRMVLRDPELRRMLGRAGRRTAEELYDWSVVGESLLARYRELSPCDG